MEVSGELAHRSSGESVKLFQPFMGMDPDEFRDLAKKILIVIPHRPSEGINKGFFVNAGVWAMLGTPYSHVSDEFEGFVEFTRGGIVRTFLNYCADHPEVEYLFMADNDEKIDWDAPYRLAQWGKDVVSGVVCSFSAAKGGVFACVVVKDRYGIGRFPSIGRTKKMPASGLREIEASGAGLICIHKRVLKAMIDKDDPPFEIPFDIRRQCCATGVLKLGEDLAFSERCRKYGFKMYVDFSVRAIHYKTMEISWPEKSFDHSLPADKWEVSDADYVHE
jgi:hypothetical protein